MFQKRLDNLIKELRVEVIELHPRLRIEVLDHARAHAFQVRQSLAWRYAVGFGAFLILGTGGTVWAAQLALPDQPLYGLKRVTETAYVNIQTSPAAQANVQQSLIDRRFAEASEVADSDNDADDVSARLAADAADSSDAWVKAQENVFSLAVAGE